ncbi:MAG: hypothetical protein RIS94_1691 [Pseudomonadota bacterium]|jgi:uncharacterized membrane protein YphA (DoxX/SURF4 family)
MARVIEKYGLLFVRYYMGGFNLLSGLNFFFHIWPQPKIAESIGNSYVQISLQLGLFQFAKVLEIVGGLSLVLNRFVPLGLVLLMPVTVNIFLLNAFWSPLPHIVVSVTRNFVFHVILLAAYANYYLPMLRFRAEARPVWRDPAEIVRSL